MQKASLQPSYASAIALALTICGGVPAAFAQEQRLAEVEVEAKLDDTNPYSEQGSPYKAKISGDHRRVKDLAETPATISVVTQQAIQESGKTDLKDVVAQQPGVTIGTGENGNAFGDRYIIRGHEARSDVFIDGLRDPGMTTRESFAVEQIEITKGPSSTFAGRGSTGGAVNSITKQPSLDKNFTKIELGMGTDEYHRMTFDTNQALNTNTALRLNVLDAGEQVPNRSPAERDRRGLLASLSQQVNDKLSVSGDYYYLKAQDIPDFGTYRDTATGKPAKHIPVYLQVGSDHLDTEVNTGTVKLNYRFSPEWRMQNATRVGRTQNSYVATGARGATTDASDPNGAYSTISLSTHQGYQTVDYLVNRTDVFWDKMIGSTKHQFVFGAEFNDEQVENGTYRVTNSGATNCILPGRGTNPPAGGYCIIDSAGRQVANINTLLQRSVTRNGLDSDYHIRTYSLTAMDTVDVSDKLSVLAGLRYDYFDYTNVVGAATKTVYDYSDGFVNGNIGVTYKVAPKGNIYASISTSTDINGGESDVGGSCGYGGLCGNPQQVADSDPESTISYELGSKWQLFNDKLLLTGAVFQTKKTDVAEQGALGGYVNTGTLNTGANEVTGVELSLVGNITQKLSAQLGAAVMNAEVTKSATAANVGKTLSNFADKSGSLQLKYQATPKVAIGGNATYQSEMYAGQPDTAAGSVKVPSYTVYDAFAEYRFNPKLSARLNVNNVTDKDFYLAAYQSGSFMYIGDKRNAHLTVKYQF